MDHRGKRWAVTPNDLLEVLRQSIAEFNEQHHIEQRLTENCRENGLMFYGLTPGDGDCFFYAISSQLERVGAGSYNVAQLRQNCVEYIRKHPTYEGPEGMVSLETFISSTLDEYCDTMAKRGTWADHVVVVNMAKMLERDILIVTSAPSTSGDDCLTWVIGDTTGKEAPLLIGHEWESHYHSLQPIEPTGPTPGPSAEKKSVHLPVASLDKNPNCDDHSEDCMDEKIGGTQEKPNDLNECEARTENNLNGEKDVPIQQEDEGYYMGNITRKEAERQLLAADNEAGAFLIRESESYLGGRVLSLRDYDAVKGHCVKHYKIQSMDNEEVYISADITFSSIEELVEHYKGQADGLCRSLKRACRKPVVKYLHDETKDIRKTPLKPLGLVKENGSGQVGEVWSGPFKIRKGSKPLSLRLFSVLDDIGASEEVRQLRIEGCVTKEILWTVSLEPEISVYNFGSQADGTTTIGMKSDMDQVSILNNLPVVTDPQDHPVGTSLLFIQDDTTPAGYCKLQLVQDGVPQCGEIPKITPYPDIYCRNRLQFTRDTDSRLVCSFKPNEKVTRYFDQRHGPAFTNNARKNVQSKDIVFAVESQSSSQIIHIWLDRKRQFNWPNDDILQTCVDLGCLFVPVGHPKCVDTEQEKQWRISFSHQEKLLVSQFSPVQYKCFIVLKIIKKELISESVPDSLSSYHVKTCMFYAIENTPCTLWKPKNLLSCISLCLRKLLEWVQAGYCPNYFIPEENMFDRSVHGTVRKRLQLVLQRLVSADCKFLYSIQSDGLGMKFKYNALIQCDTTGDVDDSDCISTESKLRVLLNVCGATFYTAIIKLKNICNNSIQSSLKKILHAISSLLNTLIITRHTFEESQQAKSLILPYLTLTLMSNIVACAVDQNKQNSEIRRLLTSIRWKEICLSSDSFSSRLKQASMLYMLGDYQTSLKVLSSLTGLVRYTYCHCYLDKYIIVLPAVATLLETTRGISDVTAQYLLRNVLIPCVYFLPTEKNVTPAALWYEMERMRGSRPDSDDDLCIQDRHLGDWAFVDGNFLLHFLLYLNHTKLNRTQHANVVFRIMKRLLTKNNADRLSHRETCYNLLGWVYRERGNNRQSRRCFRKSLKIKPQCNAASLHINELPDTRCSIS